MSREESEIRQPYEEEPEGSFNTGRRRGTVPPGSNRGGSGTGVNHGREEPVNVPPPNDAAGNNGSAARAPGGERRRSVLTGFLERLRRPAETTESQAVPETLSATEQTEKCIIIGPARSGKTFMLLALGRACFLPGVDQLELGFVPEPPPETSSGDNKADPQPSVVDLMGRAVDIITGADRSREGTLKATDYSFEITAEGELSDEWWKSRYIYSTLKM